MFLCIMTTVAAFQEFGNYQYLRQAVRHILIYIAVTGRCLSSAFGIMSCPGALVSERLFITVHNLLGMVIKFDFKSGFSDFFD